MFYFCCISKRLFKTDINPKKKLKIICVSNVMDGKFEKFASKTECYPKSKF